MINYEPIEFDYNRAWRIEQDADGLAKCWDSYGFFTHITNKMFVEEVLLQLPEGHDVIELNDMVDNFFKEI